MKLFITGAAGFVGKELIFQCQQQGIEYVAVDIIDSALLNHHKADIRSKEIINLIPERVDAVIHLAGLTSDPACKNKAYNCFDANVMATLNLIEAAQQRNIKQFIFASSEWVYGPFEESEVKNETSVIDITKLDSEYALSKLVTESNLRQKFRHGFCPVTILRFGIIYGLREKGSAVENIFNEVRTKEKIIVGSLKNGRCFLHVSDIAAGIIKALGLPGFNIINLAGNKLVTMRDLVDASQKILNKKIEIEESTPPQISIRNISNQKAKEMLGWEPQIDLESGLKKLNSFLVEKEAESKNSFNLKLCLICQSNKSENIFEYLEPDQYELTVGINKEGYFRKWVHCQECGFYYSLYSREKEILNNIYTNSYRSKISSWRKQIPEELFNKIVNLPFEESETKQRVKWIQENIRELWKNKIIAEKNPPLNFLDIGGGNGVFPYEFFTSEFFEFKKSSWLPYIVDPDQNSSFLKTSSFLNSHPHFSNLSLIHDYYRSGLFSKKFDLISLIYVLEHLSEPRNFLKEVIKDMDQNSLIYLEVPDVLAFQYKEKEDDIFNSCHLWMFDPYTLTRFLNSLGLQILGLQRLKTVRGHYSLRVLASLKVNI